MAGQGVFAVDRGIFDHPMFAPEPFTEREAWLWMLSAAAWAEKRVRVGRHFVALKRGQLAFALRFLATKFQWTDSRVRRFLKRLENDAMVIVSATREATQVTICNYDAYQFGRRTDETQSDAQTDVRSTNPRRKEEEDNNLRKIDDSRSASHFTEGSKALASAFWKALGYDSPLEIPLEFAGLDWRATAWVDAGWTVDLIEADAKRVGRGKPITYYEKVFATSFAKRQAPLPVVEIREAEKLTVTHGKVQSQSGVVAVARRWAEQFENQSDSSLEGNSDAVLRLSQG